MLLFKKSMKYIQVKAHALSYVNISKTNNNNYCEMREGNFVPISGKIAEVISITPRPITHMIGLN